MTQHYKEVYSYNSNGKSTYIAYNRIQQIAHWAYNTNCRHRACFELKSKNGPSIVWYMYLNMLKVQAFWHMTLALKFLH